MSREDEIRTQAIGRLKTMDGVGDELAGALFDAGFKTPSAVRTAGDAELLTVPGIGDSTLQKLRAIKSEPEQRKVGRHTVEWDPSIGGPILQVDTAVITDGDTPAEIAVAAEPPITGESAMVEARTSAAPVGQEIVEQNLTPVKEAREASGKEGSKKNN